MGGSKPMHLYPVFLPEVSDLSQAWQNIVEKLEKISSSQKKFYIKTNDVKPLYISSFTSKAQQEWSLSGDVIDQVWKESIQMYVSNNKLSTII